MTSDSAPIAATHHTQATSPGLARRLAVKVPGVTVIFWVIKILTTGVGETASDFMVHTIGPVVAVSLSGLAFAAAMYTQLSARRYVAARYWTAVAMVSVFGTVAADVVHVGLGVPYVVSAVGSLGTERAISVPVSCLPPSC